MGYVYEIEPDLILSASIQTNGSYFDRDLYATTGIKTDVTTWNIYYFTAGTTCAKGRSKMTLGLLYSMGTDKSRQEQGSFEKPTGVNFIEGSSTITKATYSSIGLLPGYTFVLKKN